MKVRRVMVAAPRSGSGKTTITILLLQALKERGYSPLSFKCGPDYIDPMFHTKVLGIPSQNLDTWFTGDGTIQLFLQDYEDYSNDNKIAVIEGVMGLYDGLGALNKEGSSYHLAKVTRTPIILVVDSKGAGFSLIPEIIGMLAYDLDRLIRGVIFNKMSSGIYDTLRPMVEHELIKHGREDVEVIGYVPRNDKLIIESRHLGLFMPYEISDLNASIENACSLFKENIDLDKILAIADNAKEIDIDNPCDFSLDKIGLNIIGEKIKIAVASDEAFCFYYEDNLKLLEKMGADLEFFSPIHDEYLPQDYCGILIGGGYPENYAKELSSNTTMREQIRKAVENEIPVVAECGGFMYLQDSIVLKNGEKYDMVGAIPGTSSYKEKLVRFGYVTVTADDSRIRDEWGLANQVKAHEFHYFDSTDNGKDGVITKASSGKRYRGIVISNSIFAGFPHLYYYSNPEFVMSFLRKALKKR